MPKITSDNIPVGVTDFEKLRNLNAVYIDKTPFLKSLLTSSTEVFLLLRPRRFGKTLSMSMLENFLELNYKNPEDRSRQEALFKGLKVCTGKEYKELRDKFMGRYPVISISLKSVQGSDFQKAMKSLLGLVGRLYSKYTFLYKSRKLDPVDIETLRRRIAICKDESLDLSQKNNMDAAYVIAEESLQFLNDLLFAEYGIQSVIIVDEYDVPLQKATVNGYYDEMLKVIKELLGNALKDNKNLFRGYVTGCLRIAHQSIFTDINNFDCYCLGEAPYADFIGLTKAETENLLKKCGMENRLPEVLAWYDGYNGIAADSIGNGMLCPWSVLKFLSRALAEGNDPATFRPQNFWANSSGNDIIEICMRHPRDTDTMKIQNLLEGNTEEITLREFTSYPQITARSSFDIFGTLMLYTGYFTVVRGAVPEAPNRAVIKIPNKEIRQCFFEKAGEIFNQDNDEWFSQGLDLRDSFLNGDADRAEEIAGKMLRLFVSVRDTAYESFYHGFLAGVLGMTGSSGISITSNQENGDGFSDVIIKNNPARIAAILEFKKSVSNDPDVMDSLCNKALKQIEDLSYDRDLKSTCRVIHKYGIAFYQKTCRIIGA